MEGIRLTRGKKKDCSRKRRSGWRGGGKCVLVNGTREAAVTVWFSKCCSRVRWLILTLLLY